MDVNSGLCFEEVRVYYRPEKVKVLFVGESPPSKRTFFYCANSNLYRCVRSGFAQVYGRKCGEGKTFLLFFKDYGCYLDDLCLKPVNKKDKKEREQLWIQGVEPLAGRVKEMKPKAIVILMKQEEFVNEVRNALQLANFRCLDMRPHATVSEWCIATS